jgi:hypothetical protein
MEPRLTNSKLGAEEPIAIGSTLPAANTKPFAAESQTSAPHGYPSNSHVYELGMSPALDKLLNAQSQDLKVQKLAGVDSANAALEILLKNSHYFVFEQKTIFLSGLLELQRPAILELSAKYNAEVHFRVEYSLGESSDQIILTQADLSHYAEETLFLKESHSELRNDKGAAHELSKHLIAIHELRQTKRSSESESDKQLRVSLAIDESVKILDPKASELLQLVHSDCLIKIGVDRNISELSAVELRNAFRTLLSYDWHSISSVSTCTNLSRAEATEPPYILGHTHPLMISKYLNSDLDQAELYNNMCLRSPNAHQFESYEAIAHLEQQYKGSDFKNYIEVLSAVVQECLSHNLNSRADLDFMLEAVFSPNFPKCLKPFYQKSELSEKGRSYHAIIVPPYGRHPTQFLEHLAVIYDSAFKDVKWGEQLVKKQSIEKVREVLARIILVQRSSVANSVDYWNDQREALECQAIQAPTDSSLADVLLALSGTQTIREGILAESFPDTKTAITRSLNKDATFKNPVSIIFSNLGLAVGISDTASSQCCTFRTYLERPPDLVRFNDYRSGYYIQELGHVLCGILGQGASGQSVGACNEHLPLAFIRPSEPALSSKLMLLIPTEVQNPNSLPWLSDYFLSKEPPPFWVELKLTEVDGERAVLVLFDRDLDQKQPGILLNNKKNMDPAGNFIAGLLLDCVKQFSKQ